MYRENVTEQDIDHMRYALELARRAELRGEVPVGALVIGINESGATVVVAEAFNERETLASPLAHAELTAIAAASSKLGRWRLSGCTLYVTLEPCVMCAGAIVQSRVDRVVYGARDPKAGAVESLYQVLADTRLNHRPQVTGGVLATECSQILSDFFRKRRS